MHRELVAPMRLRRRPGILIDHQPVDRHRVLGELNDPDAKPTPGRHLQAHGKEQPSDVRDSAGPVPPAPRRQPAGPREQAADHVRARQLTYDAQISWRHPRRFDAGPGLAQTSARTPEADRLVVALAARWIAEQLPR